MKMYRIAQAPSQVAGDQFNQALDPRLKTVFVKSLQGTGLSKQKVLPFLEQLFTGLGDVPLSKVTGLLKSLSAEDENPQPAQQARPSPYNFSREPKLPKPPFKAF